MTLMEAIEQRHSVRQYTDKPIPDDIVAQLQSEIEDCNNESGLHIQLVTNEPKAFDSMMAHYGKFSGVRNYFALVGKSESGLEEKAGYYGERLVIKSQMLGLNTCWVALSFSKGTVKKICNISNDEKLICVISLGYGASQGKPHKSKKIEELCSYSDDLPEWFLNGVKAAILAPTAINQQKFMFTMTSDDSVQARSKGGAYSLIDLGIVKYHFEVGSGKTGITK